MKRSSYRPTSCRHGFTLVELLVVIGIIAVLISILLPTLSRARESARRTDCASRLRQLAAAVNLYADENRGKIPPGYRDNNNTEEHTIWISQEVLDALLRKVQTPRIFSCPNLQDTQPSKPANLGWVMGYAYLGGHSALRKNVDPQDWKSPLKMGEKGLNGDMPALFCDLNDWSPVDGWTAVAHPRRGAGGWYANTGGQTAEQRGSVGGNVAYIDGSVVWRNIKDMKEHQTYSASRTDYRGMW